MFRKVLSYFTLPLLLLLSNSSGNSAPQLPEKSPEGQTATLERMIVANGNVTMDLNLDRLKGIHSETEESKLDPFRFEVNPDSFFTIRVFNDVLRGPEPGSMGLIWGNSRILPEPLNASSNQLVIEKIRSGEPFDLVVRDGKTGFVFFNVEGHLYDYDASAHVLSMNGGRLLVSEGLANKLGRPADVGVNVGEISISTSVYPIEITTVVNGAAKSSTLPPRRGRTPNAPDGSVPGPDIVVGDMPSMVQVGSSGGQVGLGIATTSCNNGDQPVDFMQFPSTSHSVISQNLYRMSGGASNNDRFEQIGQGWVKHTFGASQDNACNFGCTPYPNDTKLGVGCSDPYDASENGIYSLLGSRAWVNPFTGAFPANAANHSGHSHNGTSHRVLVNASDLNTTMNTGATYYTEVQYDTPQEYAWCQAHAGQCNMYNNASYRRFNVSGTTSFTFSGSGSTVRMTAATDAWIGATTNTIEPEPGVDGRAFIAYKVTNPSAGVWHYEYAIHNQNLDRSIQSFSVPLGCGITVSNIGFHAPPNPAGFPNDGTVGNTGFSNAAWTSNLTLDDLTWNSETLAQNQNANAIRFATTYNFRFDSDRPPQAATATIGFFKTGTPMTVGIQGPAPDVCTGTPTPTATATATGTPLPTPTATASATATAGATATPIPCETPLGESFNNIATLPGTGWVQTNHSTTVGTTSWFQGNSAVFQAQSGAATSYIAANSNNTSGTGTISNWLLTPPLHLQNGSRMTFYTRTVDVPSSPDRLQVRMSTNGDSSNVGTTATDVGDFTTLLLDVNPTYTPSGYPTVWTPFSVTVSGSAFGRLAFRYFVENGGTAGANSDYIGIDTFLFDDCPSGPTPTPSVTPTPMPAAQALNLSTRMRIQTGNEVGIGGFIVTGTVPKHVLLRAIGPSLAQFGVPNVLADPVMELHGPAGFATITDDNWRDVPVQEALIIASGIPPTNDLESAIDAMLSPGNYTAIVRGKNDTSGAALVEVYDLSQAVPAKLANISTRALVGTGDNMVIAGFILGNNNGNDRIAVRGLTVAGLPNSLPDPKLELRDSNGVLILANNDWQDDPAQAAQLIAAGLAPTNNLDAAIVAPLPPSRYTALLTGRNNGTGIGLVEVYDLGN